MSNKNNNFMEVFSSSRMSRARNVVTPHVIGSETMIGSIPVIDTKQIHARGRENNAVETKQTSAQVKAVKKPEVILNKEEEFLRDFLV